MPTSFRFSLEGLWHQNLEHLKAHLESIDAECSAILFEHLPLLQSDDPNARRDFNQRVLAALEAQCHAELSED